MLPYLTPFDTLSAEEITQFGNRMDTLSGAARDVLVSPQSANFLQNILPAAVAVDQEQQRGIARLLAEILLRVIPASDAATRLKQLTPMSPDRVLRVLSLIQSGLLAPLSLSLSDLGATEQGGFTREPMIIMRSDGTQGLRYANVNDLLADIEGLEPDARMKFLQDAKKDNRIAVLVALSRLKLGADASGRPLSLRNLIAQEASQFTATDWLDTLREDPDAIDDPMVQAALGMFASTPERLASLLHDITDASALRAVLMGAPKNPLAQTYLAYSPLAAMVAGRPSQEWGTVVSRFAALPNVVRDRLCSPQTATALANLVSHGIIPQSHVVAAGRIVMFLATGELAPEKLEQVLLQLNVPQVNVRPMATGLLAVHGSRAQS